MRERMTHPLPVPLDVKLMNLTATLLLLGFVLLALATGGRWLAHHPVFAIRGIAVLGDISHTSALSRLGSLRKSSRSPGASVLKSPVSTWNPC